MIKIKSNLDIMVQLSLFRRCIPSDTKTYFHFHPNLGSTLNGN